MCGFALPSGQARGGCIRSTLQKENIRCSIMLPMELSVMVHLAIVAAKCLPLGASHTTHAGPSPPTHPCHAIDTARPRHPCRVGTCHATATPAAAEPKTMLFANRPLQAQTYTTASNSTTCRGFQGRRAAGGLVAGRLRAPGPANPPQPCA